MSAASLPDDRPALSRVTSLPAIRPRPADGHKGTFGKVGIIAGSRGMSGAACLAGLGALRGGAGLVTVATPGSLLPIVACYEPSYLTLPLEEDAEGRISMVAASAASEMLEKISAAGIGPGLGQSPHLSELVAELYASATIPLVIDADALNALVMRPDSMRRYQPTVARILTPHPGEFARLINQPMEEIQNQREELAVRFAAEQNVVLVLKGKGTVVTDGTRIAINPTGNSGMATGGTGDVLTGLITALLGQGYPAFEAAQLGVYLHGLAGDLAAAELSEPGLISSDLPVWLGKAWKQVLTTVS